MTVKGVLNRYALVLEVVASSPHGLTFAEIMRQSKLSRATVHRLIGALVGVGYIDLDESRKIHVLGSRLLRLLHLRTPRETVVNLARPTLERLVARFAETAFIAKLEGDRVESIAMVLPESERHSYVQPGRIMPLHAAASSKAIFAFQPEKHVRRLLQRPRTAFTPNSRTDRDEILSELGDVRKQGYAACLDELDHGVSSYACPIHIAGGTVLYSVGVVGVSQRLSQIPVPAIIAALKEAAQELGERLSGHASPHQPHNGQASAPVPRLAAAKGVAGRGRARSQRAAKTA